MKMILSAVGLLAMWVFRARLKAMRSPVAVAAVAVVVAALLAFVSFSLGRDGAGEFISSLLLNIVAEAVGVGATALIGLWIARKMLRDVAPALVNVIRRLREGGTISDKAAQAMVVLSVQLLFQDALTEERDTSIAGERVHKSCSVCSLPYVTEPTKNSVHRCAHCKLPGVYWRSEPTSVSE